VKILLDIADDNPDRRGACGPKYIRRFSDWADHPALDTIHEEFLDRRYRFWNFYSYVVCYVWEQKPIQIIAIVHGARTSFRSSALG